MASSVIPTKSILKDIILQAINSGNIVTREALLSVVLSDFDDAIAELAAAGTIAVECDPLGESHLDTFRLAPNPLGDHRGHPTA